MVLTVFFWFCFQYELDSSFLLFLRRYWLYCWSLGWIKIILWAYINPLGVTFEVKSSSRAIFTIESCKREKILISCIVFSVFQYNFSPPLRGCRNSHWTTLNLVFYFMMICLDCLLVVDFLRFRCRVVNSVFLCWAQHLVC